MSIDPTGITGSTPADGSNGYEAVSKEFMSIRDNSSTGVSTVRGWAESLPRGSAVLDLGCGHGIPISEALIDDGFNVYGIDASPSLIAAYSSRFPNTPVESGLIEDSQFFGRKFDGVIAWGLIFLLAPDVQAALIHKVNLALKPGGRFLFTAPRQVCEWLDNLTGRESFSLGSDTYRKILQSQGLVVVRETEDEGENHYYSIWKPQGHT